VISELPAFLAYDPGLDSGYMIPHCTSAALVSENKVLCHPASNDTISTSGSKEDHVSMGGMAARKAMSVVENVENIVAIEILAACQGTHVRLCVCYLSVLSVGFFLAHNNVLLLCFHPHLFSITTSSSRNI
jgi:histidine ammonia-lyase